MPRFDRYKIMKTLKPCPFCGGIAYPEFSHRAFINGESTRVAYIRCKSCNARSGRFEHKDGMSYRDILEQAIEVWNQRDDAHIAEHIFTKIENEMLKMRESKDRDCSKTYIPYHKNTGFSVECIRDDFDSMDEFYGSVIKFEIYYQEDQKDIDCCSLGYSLDCDDLQSLKEFLKMWVKG